MSVSAVVYFSGLNFNPFSNEDKEGGEVCISNISPKERKKRVQFAIQYFLFTLVVLGALLAFDVNPLWRLPLFFMFSAATTSYIQALDKTWVSLASRGLRNISDRNEKIKDPAELKQVRRQALRVIVKGVLAALLLTLIAFILP